MLVIHQSSQFRRDVKRLKKHNKNIRKLEKVIEELAHNKSLQLEYKDHALIGNWAGHRDCHIEPDWILIYRIRKDVLELVRSGSHSDLFE